MHKQKHKPEINKNIVPISQQAKQSIDYIFSKSAMTSLTQGSGDLCHVVQLPYNQVNQFSDKNIVVFTISSFLFRVLTIFHIGDDAATQKYFHRGINEKSFSEIFSEAGNLCTGAMNRELLRYFPHLGMSTPYTLSGGCLQFINKLNPGHQSLHAITINDSIKLHATVCVCGYAPMDFAAEKNDLAHSTGELEMF
jgi:hypothetical protein